MKCPHCNVNLLLAERHGVEIDYCPECRGIWLDRGELDKIIELSASRPVTYQDERNYRQMTAVMTSMAIMMSTVGTPDADAAGSVNCSIVRIGQP